MGVVKTTIVIDEKTWNEFKRFVSSRYGSLRMTSLAVEEAIKCFNTADMLRSFASAMGLKDSAYLSVREVEQRRPELQTSAGEEVRRMRDKHESRPSGLQ